MNSSPTPRDEIIALIEQHQALIYKVVHSYCPERAEQEDLAQEIILQLLKSYPRFDHGVKVTTWMYRVALNVAISHYRQLQTRQQHLAPMPEKLVSVAETGDEDLSEEVVQLRAFIQALPPLNRALMLMYLDGHSHAEIAAALGISTSNVGTKITRIKQQLKKHFNPQ
jgi:RNA polymerase sigma-70 factor (ECF subfamily)